MESSNNEERRRKNTIILTVLAVITLILLVIGATYAYFSVGVNNNFGTSTINGSFDTKVGSPVELKAGLRLVNSATINQTYLAGTDINITISLVANSLVCNAVEEP